MLKVMTIVGTRPEIIKLSRVMAELDKYTEHIMVHTGQNFDYELNEIFFQELRIRKPDYFLDAAGKNAAETIANVIRKSDELMDQVKPDALLLYGDTNADSSDGWNSLSDFYASFIYNSAKCVIFYLDCVHCWEYAPSGNDQNAGIWFRLCI